MSDIRAYQSQLDSVRERGAARIARYASTNPEIRPVVEKQHQNYQESYNSLLQTGAQIKNRLSDSLGKFQVLISSRIPQSTLVTATALQFCLSAGI